MNQKSWLLNLSLLKTHPAYRAVFIARFISILSLGLLGVAVPVQMAGGVIGYVNRQRNVYRPDGRRRAGGPLRA